MQSGVSSLPLCWRGGVAAFAALGPEACRLADMLVYGSAGSQERTHASLRNQVSAGLAVQGRSSDARWRRHVKPMSAGGGDCGTQSRFVSLIAGAVCWLSGQHLCRAPANSDSGSWGPLISLQSTRPLIHGASVDPDCTVAVAGLRRHGGGGRPAAAVRRRAAADQRHLSGPGAGGGCRWACCRNQQP